MSGTFAVGDLVALAEDDARKLRVVLRRRAGDPVDIVDSGGRVFAAAVTDSDARHVRLLDERSAPRAPSLTIALAQGVPKGAKMELVVEKATELGVARVVPFENTRSVGGASHHKVERWRRVAQSAAAQCGRADVPAVGAPLGFAELCATFARYDLTLVPWELAEPVPLRERLPALLSGVRSVLVVVGPEGGLSRDETDAARAAGASLISLGPRILRTETAGLVACSALLYAAGDL